MTRNFYFLPFILCTLLIFSCVAQPQGSNINTAPKEEKGKTEGDSSNIHLLKTELKNASKAKFLSVGQEKYPLSPYLNKFYSSRNYQLAWFKKNLKPRKELFTYLKT